MEMEEMDYWRMCDELSVFQAALLILGLDPTDHQTLLRETDQKFPAGFYPVFTALCNAVKGERLKATISFYPGYNNEDEYDWEETTVLIQDLRDWLRSRDMKTGFFFPQATDAPNYLDSSHPNYAPKLAAAINAWQAANENPDLYRGKTVKQALLIWLRKNADKYGLTKEDGNPNEQGIEEIAKIANWASKGGAPKTPA
jgi:hypothetical protein